MVLTRFPELRWLKAQIDCNFAGRKGNNNQPPENTGFPSVIINTRTTRAWRPDITGPISLFLNLEGASRCKVDNHEVEIGESFYFISNQSQSYTLSIDSSKPVETFNIHIGEQFSEGVLGALTTPADKLLNEWPGMKGTTVTFFNRLYRKDRQFNQLVLSLKQLQASDSFYKLLFEEKLEALLVYLLHQHREVLKLAEKLPAAKASTRIELFRRLSMAVDYIHSFSDIKPDIEELSSAACLSKFHFLRLFRQAYGISPYQYIQSIRLDKATQLLKDRSLEVYEIAETLGFENSSSFSRLFHQRMGIYPTQYRTKVN